MLLYILAATTIGGLLSLLGGIVLLWREELAKKFSLTLVSFAIGSMLGAAFFEIIPEALGDFPFETIAPSLIAGVLVFFLFEKLLHWYHCHDQNKCDYHSFSDAVLVGDALHNFVDGVAIALSFSVSVPVGIATTVAVFFHEIPQEIGDFGVLLHAGYPRSKVLLYNFLTALTALVGALIGYFLLPFLVPYMGFLLSFIAGSFVYIAVSDLLPELRHRAGLDLGHLAAIVLGVLAVWYLGVIIPE